MAPRRAPSRPSDVALASSPSAWAHVGVRSPALADALARHGVAPEHAGVVAPDGHTWGAHVEARTVTPDAFARMIGRLARAARTAPKRNARAPRSEGTLDLFAPRAPAREAPRGFATEGLGTGALVRPWLPPQFPVGAPLVVSYGGGVDSTGLLVRFVQLGIRPDVILFADTGSEHPETYLYLDVMDDYLRRHDFPTITRVRNVPKRADYTTLETNCTSKGMFPSIAYGSHKHGCSLKWKIAPMDKWLRKHFAPVVNAIRAKRRLDVVRVIGYDAGPADVRRQEKLEAETHDRNVNWHYWYPLQEWGWDRERTVQEIAKAGLPIPPKSACWFCPSQKPWELLELAIASPELAWRVILMEHRAGPNLDTLDGLWRAPVKGESGSIARPGSMTEFLLDWMRDGRAYATLPSLTATGVAPTELASSAVVGHVYRRRLPVAGQDPSFDSAALADLARRGRAASEALRARYEATFGPYVPVASIAELAGAVSSAIARMGTARRAAARAPTDAAHVALAEAEARYADARARYEAARLARGATPAAMARSGAMFARQEWKGALRAAIAGAATIRRRLARGSRNPSADHADLAVLTATYGELRGQYGALLRSQGSSERAVAKVLAKFDEKFARGQDDDEDDDEDVPGDEGDEG